MSETATAPAAEPLDVRPIVGSVSSNRSVWIFALLLGIGGGGLFAALEARRSALTAPAVTAPADVNAGQIAPPPDLVIPPDYAELQRPGLVQGTGPVAAPYADQRPVVLRPVVPTAPVVRPSNAAPVEQATPAIPRPYQPGLGSTPAGPPGPTFSGPQVVYQASTNRASASNSGNSNNASDQAGGKNERVTAGRLENPATTVPKGTLVQAVLETALDSTRAGAARAVVTQDVRGFDGTRILIQRGSRLYGEYKADLAAGQNRALIQWQRLLRPDGVIINLDSPSADPIGRAGVKGKVNTHFFQKFSGAILQTGLSIGANLATRSVSNDAVLVALPGSTQTLAPTVNPADVKPTLKIRQGTSVSVFVARDLDFTAVEP